MGELETRGTAKGRARIISLAEAAEIIGTSYPTAVRLAESGELKAFRIRKSWRTSDAACDEFVRRQFELQALRCRSRAQGGGSAWIPSRATRPARTRSCRTGCSSR